MRRSRHVATHLVAACAILLGLRYLHWRLTGTMDGTPPALTVALFAGELYALLSLAGFAFTTWTMRPTARPAPGRLPSVDVLVATFNESDEVLRSTLTGCVALDYPSSTVWVLDDGRREWVAALAAEFGAGYLTRDGNTHAKAGNINAALPRTSGELILILDADHVPRPDMLQAIVGHFSDPHLAYVQTPHVFYNRDSIQHVSRDDHDQSLFFHVVQPGRDHHGAAFWCGSGAVIRRAALEGVGGLATETITEDFHTSLRLHEQGWRSRFHDEPLVHGIAPHNIQQFLLQRHRWAAGNLAALRTPESPLTAAGLTIRQRACYLIGLFEVFTSLQRVLLIAVLAATVAWGRLPINAPVGQFLAEFVPWAVVSTLAALLLSRGRLKLLNAVRFEYFTLPAHLRAVLSLIRPDTRFKVTPKLGIDDGGLAWMRSNVPLAALIGVLGGSLTWRAAVQLGVVPGHHLGAAVLAVVCAAALFELARLLAAAWALTRHRQLRQAYRFPARLPATIGASRQPAELIDLSTGGCAVLTEAGAIATDHLELEVDFGALGRRRFELEGVSAAATDGRMRVSGRWSPADEAARSALFASLFVLAPAVEVLDRAAVGDATAAGVAVRLGLAEGERLAA